MAQFPAFPFWTDAYMADTGHLTTIEHGAYFLLLLTMWRSKTGWIKNDPVYLRRVTKMRGQQWQKAWPTLCDFLTFKDGMVSQARLLDELSEVTRKRTLAVTAGRASWVQRKNRKLLKTNNRPSTDVTPTLERNGNHPEPEPKPSLNSSIEELSPTPPELEKSEKGNGVVDPVPEMVGIWNEGPGSAGCTKATLRSDRTKEKLRLRFKDTFAQNLDQWRAYCLRIAASPWLTGTDAKSGNWRADIRWVCEPRNVEKIMGGRYDPKPDPPDGGRTTDVRKAMGLR